ncbi:MAG: hypothetical protein GXP25_05975 [Planctomycetes bacterium]|nr:hypothetical protein [Planctomycetota bacterium]
MLRYRSVLLISLVTVWACASFADAKKGIVFTPLDGFEDASPWIKGDPKTDLEQKDATVATNTEFVKEGKQSLAFIIRVNWTKRPNEKYAKGWPMMRRVFDKPQDWSAYDYVYFWLYPKANTHFQRPRALGVGFPSADGKKLEWYFIPGMEPNKWQEVAVPLTLVKDRSKVIGISFYVAEGWYEDGDKLDFYIDDMRLARRTIPIFASCSVTSRIFPRGTAVGVHVKVEGPIEGTHVRCRITDAQSKEEFAFTENLAAKDRGFTFATNGLPPGGHYALVDLLDAEGKIVDSRKQYFRSLRPGKRSYLKLITFYTASQLKDDIEGLGVLNDSAYAGVAIPILKSYDTDPVPEYDVLKPKLDKVRQVLKIDPWPWVAFNRMIGAPVDRRGHANSHAKDINYFRAIKALDLDNEAGARADFLKIWRHAVRAAREWKSPGVMIDLEAYNDYRTYNTAWVAKERGETIEETIRKCEQLGADLAKIIADEYPQCIVWSLFSRLEKSYVVSGYREKIYTTPSYITLGLLKYAKANNIPLKYLCGGETTPGYCNKSVAILKEKIAKRDVDVAPFLERFPDRFFLAGTISPFHDYSIAKNFIQKGYKDSDFKTIGDFEPMFKALFDAYDWVWVYASSAARTEPYNPVNNKMYSEVLLRALAESAKD